uniref:DNA binding domain protein, excisionase family n=1 Tax=uncultured prokaryote TaxID=198431 RepID=H5SKN2_9ZZZZ|nr:DNA binding domain protein, excisionase family [uncultured prokaryote]
MDGRPAGDGPARVRRRGGTEVRARLVRLARQEALPIDVPPPRPPRGGRRPFSESREELIRRLLDPELTLHEASLILNVSKATLRRYTDQGKLRCTRTAGGHRRFRLSDLLELVEGEQ